MLPISHCLGKRIVCTSKRILLRPLGTSDRLQEAAAAAPSIALNIVYFVPDARKTGGSFAEVCGRIKKLVPHESLIIMEDGRKIKVEDVVDIVQMTECS